MFLSGLDENEYLRLGSKGRKSVTMVRGNWQVFCGTVRELKTDKTEYALFELVSLTLIEPDDVQNGIDTVISVRPHGRDLIFADNLPTNR